MQRRALVSGGSGQTGSYLVELLLEQGYQVFVLVRRISSPTISRLAHVEDRVEFLAGDLLDLPSLERALRTVQPHEVYNFAAQSHVGRSFVEPLHTADVTGLGALRLFEAIRVAAPRDVRVYQASSSEQFGHQPPPHSEQTPFAPVSVYGCAKAFAHFCAMTYRTGYGLHISCGISHNHESPRRGEEFVTRKITRAVGEIARGERMVLRLGRLDTARDWMHARDVARGAWLMLQQAVPDDYVLASGESHTVQEFVDRAFAVAHLNSSDYVLHDPELVRPTDPPLLRGDASKARRVLGWQPTVDFDALVEEMVRHDLAAPHYVRHG